MSENNSVLNWTFCQLLTKNPIAQNYDHPSAAGFSVVRKVHAQPLPSFLKVSLSFQQYYLRKRLSSYWDEIENPFPFAISSMVSPRHTRDRSGAVNVKKSQRRWKSGSALN